MTSNCTVVYHIKENAIIMKSLSLTGGYMEYVNSSVLSRTYCIVASINLTSFNKGDFNTYFSSTKMFRI